MQFGQLKRREFMTLLGAATAWPLSVRAQQSDRMRQIGVLMAHAGDDPQVQARIAAFQQALATLGWSDGRNIRIDMRAAGGNAEALRKYATELLALAPDVLVAFGSAPTDYLLQATRTAPIVFTIVVDPLGAGFVNNLARPGGNATGFMLFEYSLSGKWLDLLKQIAPDMRRVAVIRDPSIASGTGQFGAIQSAAPSLGIEASPVNVRDASDIERDLTAFARSLNGGVIVTSSPEASRHRDLIIALVAKHRLPAIYAGSYFVAEGGLISYGPDYVDQYRRAAAYVDRILKGEKPADMPVQAPTKYELSINLKTAKSLGVAMPASLLARADEVIE